MKDIAKSKEECKLRVEHILSQKYEEEDLEEDLESFIEAYSMGRTSNPFTEDPALHQIDKKLVHLQGCDANEQRINEILCKIKAKNNGLK